MANKNRTFFEIPYFCSHYRYNQAVICWSVKKLQQKTTSNNFLNQC